MDEIEQISYEDLLGYAQVLADRLLLTLSDDIKFSKENLAQWISDNEPNYNPIDEV